jgi:hypothetical protein
MADIESPSLEYQETLARMKRSNEETEKFVAEQHKLLAEQYKLLAERYKLNAEGDKFNAESDKYKRDRFMYPISIGLGFLGALLGSAMVLAGQLLR